VAAHGGADVVFAAANLVDGALLLAFGLEMAFFFSALTLPTPTSTHSTKYNEAMQKALSAVMAERAFLYFPIVVLCTYSFVLQKVSSLPFSGLHRQERASLTDEKKYPKSVIRISHCHTAPRNPNDRFGINNADYMERWSV
jgi:hypothetical protein